MWMHSFLDELELPQERPAILFNDNMGAAALAKDAKGHARVKHIDIREHYIRERVAAKDIEIQHVESTNTLADLFTNQQARGKGVGRLLIEAVYEKAKAKGCSRVYWQTHETNAVAQVLYNKVAERSGFIIYRQFL